VAQQCRDFLNRLRERQVIGFTTTLVVAEVTHRVMVQEAGVVVIFHCLQRWDLATGKLSAEQPLDEHSAEAGWHQEYPPLLSDGAIVYSGDDKIYAVDAASGAMRTLIGQAIALLPSGRPRWRAGDADRADVG
jgi:hypothetical protein